MDPTDPNVLDAASNPFGSALFQGLFKSADGGASWSPINSGLEDLIAPGTIVTALIVDPTNPGVLYAGTAGYGVFKSSNGGARWSAFNDGLTYLSVRALALAPGAPHLVYARTSGGVFQIDDAPVPASTSAAGALSGNERGTADSFVTIADSPCIGKERLPL
jgi:hypothetical protein